MPPKVIPHFFLTFKGSKCQYTRKSNRALWTEEELQTALEIVRNKFLNANKTRQIYQIHVG